MDLQIKIRNISLLANNFFRDYNLKDDIQRNIQADIQINYDFSKDKHIFGVRFSYEIEIPAEKEGDNPQFIYYSLHFAELEVADYQDTPEDKKKIDRFININVAAMIFPFVREHLATTTMKAGMAPVFIPSINFIKRYKEINSL